MSNFSVLILTLNEEKEIAECINSVSLSNDIVILDSFSTDRTKEIVLSQNARFFERSFTNYSEQRNYGLHDIVYKNDYVLILDADERASEELVQEIISISKTLKRESPDVYFVRRRVLFEEKILKWNYTSTVWIERLVRPNRVTYVGNVHEKINFDGDNGFLQQYIVHNQFSKGIDHWIGRRKKYALLEYFNPNEDEEDWTSDNVILRRVKIKKYFIENIPFAYLLYFFYNLIVKFAFLDGYKGIKYIGIETYSFFLSTKYKNDVKKHTINKVPASIGKEA